ncbi:type 4b pilus protein PilO2 [Pseudomonas aeruginosa]|uniref:type 4b pilus protein PilO2 n=1 Tax=Pseudomonas aeruginosa TaxID=287 RepID=UPI003D9B677B
MEKPDIGSRGPDVSILSYHGNKFVSGLFWRPLSSQRQYMKEARKLGKEEHLDIVAIRHSPTVIQAGFVSKSQGAVKGMYSLASALSGQFEGDFLACWKVDEDRYALVATLDGAIVPGQDLVTTFDEARDRIRKLSTRGVLRNAQVFVPEGFDFPVKDFDIEELLAPKRLRRDYRLGNSPSACPQVDGGGPARLLVGGSLTAYYLWNAHSRARQTSRAPRGAERLASCAERNAQAKQPLDLASCRSLGRSCLTSRTCYAPVARQLRGTVAVDPGLALRRSSKCDGRVLVATCHRTGNSTAADLTAASQHLFADRPAFVIDSNTAAPEST